MLLGCNNPGASPGAQTVAASRGANAPGGGLGASLARAAAAQFVVGADAGAPFGVASNVFVAVHCTKSVKDADETAKSCGGADRAPCS